VLVSSNPYKMTYFRIHRSQKCETVTRQKEIQCLTAGAHTQTARNRSFRLSRPSEAYQISSTIIIIIAIYSGVAKEKENKLYALVARDDCVRLQMAESTNRIKYLQQTNACKDASTYLLRIRHKADRAGTFRPHPGVA